MFTEKQEDKIIIKNNWSSIFKLSLICLVALIIFTTTQKNDVFSYSSDDHLEYAFNCTWNNVTKQEIVSNGMILETKTHIKFNCSDVPTNLTCTNATEYYNITYPNYTVNTVSIGNCILKHGVTIISQPSGTKKCIDFTDKICDVINDTLTCKKIGRGGNPNDGHSTQCKYGEVCSNYTINVGTVNLTAKTRQKDKDGVELNVQ